MIRIIWGNATVDDLIQDSKKALKVLIQQPDVDPKRISIIGHSEGTFIAPRITIDNSTRIKNIILMGAVAQDARDLVQYQAVSLPLQYATQVLDKNHTGLISIQQIAKDPLFRKALVMPFSVSRTNNTKAITNTLVKMFDTNDSISIDKQLKPLLIKDYENSTAFNSLKCNNIIGCP